MKKRIRLSIGIPAYNEAKQIKKLLTSILRQKNKNFILQEILVVVDGSSDKTAWEVKKIKHTRIKLIIGKERLGKSARLNQIFSLTKGDVLFILDADVTIPSSRLFSHILERIDFSFCDLLGITVIPLKAQNLFEKILNYSMALQLELRSSWNKRDNPLSFRGAFLGFSKKFIKKAYIPPEIVCNDTYFYFLAKKLGMKTGYLPTAIVQYRSPTNFSDHLSQSSRFQHSKKEMHTYFSLNSSEYRLPFSLLVKLSVVYFLKNPILFSGYGFIALATRIAKKKTVSNTWKISLSTKYAKK